MFNPFGILHNRDSVPSPVHFSGDLQPIIDGFGSHPLAHTLETLSKPFGKFPLENVQVLTRFCAAEKPYWRYFCQHYSRLGAEKVHVCVQTDNDEIWLRDTGVEACDSNWLSIHRLKSNCPPNVALQDLNLDLLRDCAPFTLLLDCDEFLSFQCNPFSVSDLLNLYPNASQWHLPWLMFPNIERSFANAEPRGFWGHVGKPIVRSKFMHKIVNDHLFSLTQNGTPPSQPSSSIPLGIYGIVLVHLWGRSFRDTLIKTFFNNFDDAKSSDKKNAMLLISSGEVPIRLRLLAYLSLQERFLPLGLDSLPVFDIEIEGDLLRQWLSLEDEQKVHQLFLEYRSRLANVLVYLPRYPAASLLELASKMPSLHSLI